MNRRTVILSLLLVTIASATRLWSREELEKNFAHYQPTATPPPPLVPPGPRRFNYLKRIKWICDFVARYQVSDSSSPDFGGVIEAEHLPTTIETDNTQEAVWVWTRWYQLTGRDDYRENTRRAWVYIRRNPAYREHLNNPQNIWYAVWNCGLGMMIEPLYRQVYQDSNHLYYADSCRNFYITQRLNPANILDNFVTAQASGMAYDYALNQNDTELLDTALARGIRVKNWIQENARTRLSSQYWAMSGGTAFWGVVNTFARADTVAGRSWVEIYGESLPGFYPTQTWNCSHNLWLAYAYRAAHKITGNNRYGILHQYLSDTLLMRDTDRDGGIPATWTDPDYQDQTWVSTYLHFMGLDRLIDTVYNLDVAVYEFLAPSQESLYIEPCTLTVSFPFENIGTVPITGELHCRIDSVEQTQLLYNLPVWVEETVALNFSSPLTAGRHRIEAYFSADENPTNDSIRMEIKVYRPCFLSGRLLDSLTATPISARIKAYLNGSHVPWDSAITNPAGEFSLQVLDSLFEIVIEPEPPYSQRCWTVALAGDTTLTLYAQPAQVIVVNNDTLENYASYYTSTLDSLGVTYALWPRRTRGELPGSLLDRLQNRLVIWFSGNSQINTVPFADQETLTQFIARGGHLLLTGQNIAEELAGTNFLENILGCRFDSSGYRGFLVFGNRYDSVGRTISGTATAGGNGANNQNSRDIISSVNGAVTLLVYDTITNLGASVRYQHNSGGRVITLGFGFEAVNRPPSRPDYLNRLQLMNALLQWLIYGTGIAESDLAGTQPSNTTVSPTVFRNHLHVTSPRTVPIVVFDRCGRKIFSQLAFAGKTQLNLSYLPAGVYFLRAGDSPLTSLIKLK
ncbi:MAG: hypothetical protein ACUVUD_00520 [bacterium]